MKTKVGLLSLPTFRDALRSVRAGPKPSGNLSRQLRHGLKRRRLQATQSQSPRLGLGPSPLRGGSSAPGKNAAAAAGETRGMAIAWTGAAAGQSVINPAAP